MASYEKIVKHVIEKFEQALSPLREIAGNQEVIIKQNIELQELLKNLHYGNHPRELEKSEEGETAE